MGIKYYKLEGYYPYWINDQEIVCWDSIEDIVKDVGAKWTEVKNFEWIDIGNLNASGSTNDLPIYVKVDVNGEIYYYYLGDKTGIKALKDNKNYYNAVYVLDDYQTVFINKLKKLYEANPRTYAIRGFQNRWYKKDGDNYTVDFIKQRYLSNHIQSRNSMMVRELSYYTSESTLWELNFNDTEKPQKVIFSNIAGSGTYELPFSLFEWRNTRGRYEYIICKPTSIMSSNNEKTRPSNTKQKFIIIPLLSGYQDSIMKALNDFDITGSHTYLLDPWGDNEIGLYECDIPFSFWVGCNLNELYGLTCSYIEQPMSSSGDEVIKIPYFEVNNNAPIKFKIIDYSNYNLGFAGKFTKMIENIESWIPQTEPAMFAPEYYREVYNNGASNLVSDASYFTFNWTKDKMDETGVEAYISPQDNLNIAYNYGSNTNTALPTWDNTQTTCNNISLSNMYFGSASANYFTTNATTTNTSIAVRASEQKQSIIDQSLDTARQVNNSVYTPSGIGDFVPWNYAVKAAQKVINAGLNIAQGWVDTNMRNERANRQLRSSINNLTSSPVATISNPSTKAIIPNNYGLFETYSIHLHPSDEAIVFMDITHNGYVINDAIKFQDLFNRRYMNVINLDTSYFRDDILKIFNEETNSTFNTKNWNIAFINWLSQLHRVYYTHSLINCVDYTQSDYFDNVEKEIPSFPVHKININTLEWNFKDYYDIHTDRSTAYLLSLIKQDNQHIPQEVWDEVDVVSYNTGGFHLKVVNSVKYIGSIVHYCEINEKFPWNGLVFKSIEGTTKVNVKTNYWGGGYAKGDLYYTKDFINWTPWCKYANNKFEYYNTLYINEGEEVGIWNKYDSGLTLSPQSYRTSFAIDGKLDVSGNIMSLLNFTDRNDFNLYGIFYVSRDTDIAGLVSAENLTFPDITYDNCYSCMFLGCRNLIKAPKELPALKIASKAYEDMFEGCSSLTSAPIIKGTQFVNYSGSEGGSYQCRGMFANCSSLKINNTGSGTSFFTCPKLSTYEYSYQVEGMFANTGGSYTSNPVENESYYYE